MLCYVTAKAIDADTRPGEGQCRVFPRYSIHTTLTSPMSAAVDSIDV